MLMIAGSRVGVYLVVLGIAVGWCVVVGVFASCVLLLRCLWVFLCICCRCVFLLEWHLVCILHVLFGVCSVHCGCLRG